MKREPTKRASKPAVAADPADDAVRLMPPRTRAGAAAWLLTSPEVGRPILFEEAAARGLIVWREGLALWAGSLFGAEAAAEPADEAQAPAAAPVAGIPASVVKAVAKPAPTPAEMAAAAAKVLAALGEGDAPSKAADAVKKASPAVGQLELF